MTTTNKRSVSMETFNCHGFKESCDYIVSRMSITDFMCLTETWIKHSEHELIQKTINDHLPLRMIVNIKVPVYDNCISKMSHIRIQESFFTNWSSTFNNVTYSNKLSSLLNEISTVCIDPGEDAAVIQNKLDNYIENLKSACVNAAKASNVIPHKLFRPKKYWCPDLSRARDTKRFWWHLWLNNGRPRSGEVYKCYKNVKKLYRKLTRQCIYSHNNELYQSLDNLLTRDSNKFWKTVRKKRKSSSTVYNSVQIDKFVDHYSSIMQDNRCLTPEQNIIANNVAEKYAETHKTVITHNVCPDLIDKCVAKLRRNSSPGIDNLCAEFLIYGRSRALCHHLSVLYSTILTYNYVPNVFSMGVIVPVLKKPTLNPSLPVNYRPITVSSVLAKLFEILILPENVPLCNNQFGFRAHYGVSHGLSLLNDLMCVSADHRSNMFICSLDAEKCFDSIWHDGLFYKLRNIFDTVIWRFLYNWYSSLEAVIKWDGHIHRQYSFKVTRGTRQGSILSPTLFNVFLSDLLKQLNQSKSGLCIGDKLYNSFAYADDITLFCATVPGLQKLIDICNEYANSWRFNFGIQKSKCMAAGTGSKCFKSDPVWFLGNMKMETVCNLDILGVTFNNNNNYDDHVKTRISKCKRSMYSLNSIGFCYPGLNTSSKVHLYKTICHPTLSYGMDSLNVKNKCIKQLESTQGCVIKQVCGLNKRAHHSSLLRALDIESVKTCIDKSTTLILANARALFYSRSPYQGMSPREHALLVLLYRTMRIYVNVNGLNSCKILKQCWGTHIYCT